MATTITYTTTSGSTRILEGHPTPFFSKTVEYVQVGERWCQAENWTISGALIGCTLDDLNTARNSLLAAFSSAFGTITIDGGGGTNFTLAFVEIQNIDVDEVEYIGSLPYSISLVYYPSESFNTEKGYWGVLNPVDSVTYTENDDGTMDMSREISAKGIFTNSIDKNSPLNNAIAFINLRKPLIQKPFLIRNVSNSAMKYYLVSSEESYNRITNEAKCVQKYKTDLTVAANGDIVHRYTISEDENVSEMTTTTYSGQINVGKSSQKDNPLEDNLKRARDAYLQFKKSLEVVFLTNEEVKEDQYAGILTYRLSFYKNVDENNFPEIQDDIVITLKEDSSSSLFTVSVNGAISANYGCLEDRAEKITAELEKITGDSIAYNYGLANILYANFYTTALASAKSKPANVKLQKSPLSKSHDVDTYSNTSSYSAEFNDRYIPSTMADCQSFDLTISKTLAVPQFAIKENYVGGKYICQELGFNGLETIKGDIVRNGAESFKGEGACKNYIGGILSNMLNPIDKVYDESPSYSKSEYEKSETYSLTKSCTTNDSFEIEPQ